jgi:chemotaxis response regulator CheB
MKKSHSISIVEDDASLGSILCEIIGASPDWRLIRHFSSAESALEEMKAGCPEVVLMDIQARSRPCTRRCWC